MNECLGFNVVPTIFQSYDDEESLGCVHMLCTSLMQGGFPPLFYQVLPHRDDLPKAPSKPSHPNHYTGTGQPVVALSPKCRVLGGEATTTSFKVLGVTRPRFDPGSPGPEANALLTELSGPVCKYHES